MCTLSVTFLNCFMFSDIIKILTNNIFMDICCLLNVEHLNCLNICFYNNSVIKHLGTHVFGRFWMVPPNQHIEQQLNVLSYAFACL